MIFASVCISEEETITTTAPPVDTFFLSMMVDGADYQDVGLDEIKAMPYEQVDSTWRAPLSTVSWKASASRT